MPSHRARERERDRRQTDEKLQVANWHFAHFWMRQASQFYFHLVWYSCDTLTADCHSILSEFYYGIFLPFFLHVSPYTERKTPASRSRSREPNSPTRSVPGEDITICLICAAPRAASIKYASFQFAFDNWQSHDVDFYSILKRSMWLWQPRSSSSSTERCGMK